MTIARDIAAQNKAIITAAMNALAQGDSRPYAAAMAEDFTWRPMGSGPWGKVYEGRDVVGRELFAPLWAQYEGRATTTPVHIFADGDHVIVEALGKATLKSGKPYNNRYCFVIRMRDGKMTEVREYLDTLLSDTTLDATVL
jgi:ketosteroid isomerase-like protein